MVTLLKPDTNIGIFVEHFQLFFQKNQSVEHVGVAREALMYSLSEPATNRNIEEFRKFPEKSA